VGFHPHWRLLIFFLYQYKFTLAWQTFRPSFKVLITYLRMKHTYNQTVYSDIVTYKIPGQVTRDTGVREMLHFLRKNTDITKGIFIPYYHNELR